MDNGNTRLRQRHPQTNQGVAADAIATIEGIDRTALDELAAESQRRAEVAIKEGRFDRSLVPVFHQDGSMALDREEYPRPGTTTSRPWRPCLPHSRPSPTCPSMRPAPPTASIRCCAGTPISRSTTCTTPGTSSSGVVDGAAAILLSSPAYASAHGLTPRARVVAIANIGDDPTLMLNAPVPAARKVLAKAGLGIGDIDIFEVNEAFAVVAEKFIRDLDVDRDKINVNGGSHRPRATPSGPRAACSSARPSMSWSAGTASSA